MILFSDKWFEKKMKQTLDAAVAECVQAAHYRYTCKPVELKMALDAIQNHAEEAADSVMGGNARTVRRVRAREKKKARRALK